LLIFLRRSAHFSTETEVNQRFGRNGQLNEIPAKPGAHIHHHIHRF
jgi:hypothetical protein